MNSTEKRLRDLDAGKSVAKGDICAIRKAINARERRDRGFPLNAQEDKAAPRATLYETAVSDREPRVSSELHESGLAILRNPRWRSRFTDREREIIAAIDHFRLTGFETVGATVGHAVPIFRAVASNGESFTFRNIPWQTAHYAGELTGPEVIREHG